MAYTKSVSSGKPMGRLFTCLKCLELGGHVLQRLRKRREESLGSFELGERLGILNDGGLCLSPLLTTLDLKLIKRSELGRPILPKLRLDSLKRDHIPGRLTRKRRRRKPDALVELDITGNTSSAQAILQSVDGAHNDVGFFV